ncbi:MAG: AMP-binding protein [Pseudomonadota bacterium]
MDYTTDKFDVFPKTQANYVPLSPLSFMPRTALMFGDRTSLIYGARRYTWAETFDRCKRVASALQKRGIGKGDTVAIISPNLPEMVEAHYAVPASGAVLNTINTRLDPETIAYILNHGEAKVLLADNGMSDAIKAALDLAGRDDLKVIDIIDDTTPGVRLGDITYDDLIAEGDADWEWRGPDDEWDALALNYTSGTSGRPKGVVYHHRGSYLMTMGTIADWSVPKHPTYLYVVPLFHCNGWGHAWTMCAQAAKIVCTRAITPEDIYDAIDQHGVTHFGGAPIVLGLIVNADDTVRKPFDHQIEVMTAGAPPPAAILEGVEKLGFNVTQVYGLTETYGHTVMCSWNSDWDDVPFAKRAEIKARQGAGMVMTEKLRVATDAGDVPMNGAEQGEMLIRGNTVMKGYLKDPAATEKAFAGGWFHSEDVAVMHERGYSEVKDRLKDVIISGGENISSVEIESTLHKHPAVSLAAVVAKPDEKWGEVPCAFIELKDGETATAEEIIAFTREHLAGFKCPKDVRFGELPKTATGKIQKFELRNGLKAAS